MKRRTGKVNSVPGGLLLSLVANFAITTVGTFVLAVLLNRKAITWSNTGYWIMCMLIVSAFAGGKVAISSIKSQRYLISLMSGLLYWMCLVCMTALFFGGRYDSILETGMLIISGSLTAALLHDPRKRNIARKTIPTYR